MPVGDLLNWRKIPISLIDRQHPLCAAPDIRLLLRLYQQSAAMLGCLNKTVKYSSVVCTDGDEIMLAYIEIMGAEAMTRHELHPFDLWAIGKFTRENILSWLERGNCLDGWGGVYGYEDFHAVCGNIDIPWATEEARRFCAEVDRR